MAIAFNKIRNKLGLDDTLPFGRHQGYTVLEIIKDRPSYISWLIQNTGLKFYKSVHEELSRYLKKHVPRGATGQHRYTQLYYGDIRGEQAHAVMSDFNESFNDDPVYLEGFDDVPF